jgi:hypothetical protein
MSQSHTTALARRHLLAGAGTAGALATAGAALSPGLRGTSPSEASTGQPKPDAGGGYQVTQHVMRYYQTAKV